MSSTYKILKNFFSENIIFTDQHKGFWTKCFLHVSLAWSFITLILFDKFISNYIVLLDFL